MRSLLFVCLLSCAFGQPSNPGSRPTTADGKTVPKPNDSADDRKDIPAAPPATPSVPSQSSQPSTSQERAAAITGTEKNWSDRIHEGFGPSSWSNWGLVATGVIAGYIALRTLSAIREQARIARISLNSARMATNASRTSADAAKQSAEAAVQSNKLTMESNRITTAATELTRQSIALTHRPKLVLRHVVVHPSESCVRGNPSFIAAVANTIKTEGGELHLANIGDGEAKVNQVHSEIFRGDRLPMAPPYDKKAGTIMPLTVAPGGYITIPFPSEAYPHQTSVARVESGYEFFWVLGWIEYSDALGNQRRTGFCRKWDNGYAQFLPEPNSPYEYAD